MNCGALGSESEAWHCVYCKYSVRSMSSGFGGSHQVVTNPYVLTDSPIMRVCTPYVLYTQIPATGPLLTRHILAGRSSISAQSEGQSVRPTGFVKDIHLHYSVLPQFNAE